MIRIAAALGILLLLAITAYACRWLWLTRDSVIWVDPGQSYQTINGWEVTARMWEYDKAGDRYTSDWEQDSEEIFDRLINELGINRIRIEIRSGAENPVDYWQQFEAGEIGYLEVKRHFYEKVNDNDDPEIADPGGFQFSFIDHQVERILRPLQRLMANKGERLLVNLCYVDFNKLDAGDYDHALLPEEYAELIATTFKHLDQAHGLVPDMLEIILEPDNSKNWRGKQIGEALLAASRRLADSGYEPELIAPSTSHSHRAAAYFDEMIAVEGVAAKLDSFAYHRYGMPAFFVLDDIWERAERFGLRTAMLEHTQANADSLHEDLSVANVSAWQQYGIAERAAPGSGKVWTSCYVMYQGVQGAEKIQLGGKARYLAQYFKHIREGAVRLGATTSNGAKAPVAFRNRDGSHVLVINSQKRGLIEVRGLPEGRYAASVTTEAQTAEELPLALAVKGEGWVFEMPDSGVLTLKQLN